MSESEQTEIWDRLESGGSLRSNGSRYISYLFRVTLQADSIKHLRIPSRRPQPKARFERSDRTLADEWVHTRI